MQRIEPDDRLSGVIIAAALEVHRTVGPGFLESIYDEALAIELGIRGVPFERQVPLRATYKGYSIGEGRADYVVDGQVVVELKTVEAIVPIHVAQVLSYLRASALTLGLLINFNTSLLRQGIRRVVLSRP